METHSNLNAENTVHVREMIAQKRRTKSIKNATEKSIPFLLLLIETFYIILIFEIFYILFADMMIFFYILNIFDFFSVSVLNPLYQNRNILFVPLQAGTSFY